MFPRMFPVSFDNHYRGQKAALWLFCLLVFVNLAVPLTSIFAGDSGAQSADGIPLDTFGVAGAQAVVAVVAVLGLVKLLLGLLCVLALVRYRAMIPLLYLLLLVELLARKGIYWLKPLPHLGTPSGFYVNLALIALTLVGWVLALSGRGYTRQEAASV